MKRTLSQVPRFPRAWSAWSSTATPERPYRPLERGEVRTLLGSRT